MDKVNQLYMAVKQASMEGDAAEELQPVETAESERRSMLINLSKENPQLHAFVKSMVEKMEQQAGQQGVNAVLTQHNRRNISDYLSGFVPVVGMGALGAAGGAIVGDKLRPGGATPGAFAGVAVGLATGKAMMLAGALAAALTKSRTKEEQRAANRSSKIPSYLVPGIGQYDFWKRRGYENRNLAPNLLRRMKTMSAGQMREELAD